MSTSVLRVGTIAVSTILLGCDPERHPVGPTQTEPTPSLAVVANPGSLSIESESGTLRLNDGLFEFVSGIGMNGSVGSTGAITIPRFNIVFADQVHTMDSPLGTFTFRLRFTANSDAIGQIGQITSLSLNLRIDVDPQGSAPPGFGSDCRITPVPVSLSSANIGGIPYDASTGRVTMTDHGFSAPAPQGCGSAVFGAVDYNNEIANWMGLPTNDTDALVTVVTNPKVVLDAPPSLTPPAPLTIGTNAGCSYVGSIGTATASDDNGTPTVTNNAPAAFPLGSTTVIWTATDAFDNTTTASQLVTVTDDDAPIITAPPDLSLNPNDGASYVGPIGDATATDNCSSGAELIIASDAPAGFPPGTTTVTWTASDAAGNTATTLQRVTVAFTAEIDVVPGTSFPIRLSGFLTVVTVVVRTTPDANAGLINPATATLGDGEGTEAGVKTYRGTPIAALVDVDHDGDKDFVLTFNEADLVANGDLTTTTTSLLFQADRTDGSKFRGTEAVTVTP